MGFRGSGFSVFGIGSAPPAFSAAPIAPWPRTIAQCEHTPSKGPRTPPESWRIPTKRRPHGPGGKETGEDIPDILQ